MAHRAGTGARHGSPGAIPHTVSDHLCIDFVNSRFADHTGTGRVYDRLELEEWRRWFVHRCGFATQWPLDGLVQRELVALRNLLRTLLESGEQPDNESVAGVNRCLSLASQSWELTREPHGLQLIPHWSDTGWPAVMACVASSYVSLLVQGGVRLVRVCANPDCSFMFYDDSRNRSRRWCDVAICGNLLKVRRHREQIAALPGP
jgi:predicted RNA-binding Zn ribbon-like protein